MVVHERTVRDIMSIFSVKGAYYGCEPENVGKIGRTTAFFDVKLNSLVHRADANTIFLRCSGSNVRRLIAYFSFFHIFHF